MAFNWNDHLRETAEWLVAMSEIPAAQEHAKLRRDEKLADPMYAGLKEEIQRVRALRSPSPASPSAKGAPAPAAAPPATSGSTPRKRR